MIQRTEFAKRSFKIGDRIRLRPRFAHLYSCDFGVIIGVVSDPMRALFNEYVIEFSDQSSASLFQFQISRVESIPEDPPQSRTA